MVGKCQSESIYCQDIFWSNSYMHREKYDVFFSQIHVDHLILHVRADNLASSTWSKEIAN